MVDEKKVGVKDEAWGIAAWVAARLSEKSTYSGLGTLLAFGLARWPGFQHYAGDLAVYIMDIGVGLGGILTIIMKEKGSHH